MATSPSFTPTSFQQACVEAASSSSSSLMVQAYAGCAKTSSLVLMAQALPAVPSLALVFNAKNKKEMETKFPKHFDCRTLNGLGHGAWGRAIGKRLTLNDKKLGGLVSSLFSEVSWKGPKDDWDYVRQSVSAAMNAGLVPKGMMGKALCEDTDEAWASITTDKMGYYEPALAGLAREVLIRSIKFGLHGEVSFDDQIYLSALFGGVFPKFPLVMVDEAQDLSILNHIQLSKTTPGNAGRLIVVGDKFQAIYGWRGASSDSMDRIRRLKQDWQDLTLPETFRCPKVLVARQHHHVPQFRAFPSNPEGTFIAFKRPDDTPFGEPFWSWKDIEELRAAHGASSVAILCRNNSPLFTTAFRLIRQGVGCMMLGRDIGKSLASLLKKIIPEPGTSIKDCIIMVTAWMDREVALARANGNDDKADTAHDRGYCLIAVAETAPNLHDRSDLLLALESIFANSSALVQLSTIHRAKGLEWDLVVHLDPWRVPSKRSLDDPAALQQEKNLKYVCETRARLVLANANAEDLVRG